MKKEVSIHLESRQRNGSQQEKIEKDLRGTYFLKEKIHYFAYEERPKQRIVIKVKEESLTLIQSGENSWTHLFRKGETSGSSYLTPYGSLWLEVTTNHLRVKETAELFKIELSYLIFGQGEDSTRIDLNLTVNKRGDQNESSGL